MERRRLGHSNLEVGVLALGTAPFGGNTEFAVREQKDVDAIVGAALDAGITLFDTAQTYGSGQSEKALGMALRGRRERALIATKFREFEAWDKADILARLKASLDRLETDHVDLYQIHWPAKKLSRADIEAVTAAFDEALKQGLTRAVGMSNFRLEHLRLLTPEALMMMATNQVPYNLLEREYDAEGATAFCLANRISYLAYSPSAHGLLTGRYGRDNRPTTGGLAGNEHARASVYPATVKLIEELQAVATSCGRTPVQVALNWVLSQKIMGAAIVGTRSVAHLHENLGALGWRLDAESAARLDRASMAFHQRLAKSCEPHG